jgi:hypothetical protein
MFRGNQVCTIFNRTAPNLYGEFAYSSGTPARCSLVNSEVKRKQSSSHGTLQGSLGHADESVNDFVILVDAKYTISKGDRITVLGYNIYVEGVEPKFEATSGLLDHFRIVGSTWAQG